MHDLPRALADAIGAELRRISPRAGGDLDDGFAPDQHGRAPFEFRLGIDSGFLRLPWRGATRLTGSRGRRRKSHGRHRRGDDEDGTRARQPRHTRRLLRTCNCASDRASEALTDAISSSEIVSRRRAAARARFFGPGFVDALGTHRHVGHDRHVVARDLDDAIEFVTGNPRGLAISTAFCGRPCSTAAST